MDEYIMAIDMGSTKLTLIMARYVEYGIEVETAQSIPYFDTEERDFRDTDFLVSQVRRSVTDFRNRVGNGEIETILGVPGYFTGILENSCSMDIDGGIVQDSHISQLLQRCSQYPLPEEWSIFKVLPRGYNIDGIHRVEDPIGMEANVLELYSSLVCVDQEFISKMADTLAEEEIYIDYIRPTLLSSGSMFLSERERQSGGILIDIGDKSTDIVVYRDGVPVLTEWFPVGGHSVINDIAVGLDISLEEAKKLREQCTLGAEREETPLGYGQEIAEMRIEELIELIKESIDNSKTIHRDTSSAVIIGDGLISMRGTRQFIKNLLGSEVKVERAATASTYALIHEHTSTLPSSGMEEDELSIKAKIKNWFLAFFNK